MPKKDTACTEVLNEVISRYSRVVFENTEGSKKDASSVNQESDKDFWPWFCKSMNEDHFRKCFEGSQRTDFYGSLDSVRKQYEEKCK